MEGQTVDPGMFTRLCKKNHKSEDLPKQKKNIMNRKSRNILLGLTTQDFVYAL